VTVTDALTGATEKSTLYCRPQESAPECRGLLSVLGLGLISADGVLQEDRGKRDR